METYREFDTTTALDRDDYVGGITVGGLRSGTSPAGAYEFVFHLVRHGYSITQRYASRPTNHRIIGCGVGHDDAQFCEERQGSGYGSMAAYYENGEAFRGERWWDENASRTTRQYYDVEAIAAQRRAELAEVLA